jgi:ABC transporter substrate binding protein
VTALHEELRKLGWIDGRNLRVDHRWAAGNPERATAFAKELVALKPDVIVAHTTPSVVAMQKQTDTIPIVFVQISDPIGTGFITNLARPDGNITGFTNFESSMVGKWVECLKRWRRASRGWRFYSIRKRLHMSPDITRDHWRPLRGHSGCRRWQAPFKMPVRSKVQSFRSGASREAV